ncbi:NUDIX domain-containing protein [Herbiconiux sp. CPCC 205763]|uniref:NUDIX domain-containing protein n=1 Tax=Herbiconiux aconitum TaxID=2970913 RepID=A0ABT2GQL1_9MICO|nr:NUDIX domain-containing protein [Herbiconiux aconitum]MCS5717061.1 NUDIX domain-containing protein [Herbiconiux aconitum]
MPTPDFVLALREKIGHAPLWLTGITAVVTRGDELLLVRRSDTGAWTPVTGIVDPGEEPAVAAAREVLEEAAVVAHPVHLAWVHTIPMVTYPNGDQSQYLDLTFRMRYESGDPFPADGENTEARWFAPTELPEMSDDMRSRIRYALDEERAARFES